jgi:transcription initiation factor TFIIIB Brf1 subunit/transcription initiation factor TFIIB
MHWKGDCILDLSRAFLDTNGVKQKIDITVEKRDFIKEIVQSGWTASANSKRRRRKVREPSAGLSQRPELLQPERADRDVRQHHRRGYGSDAAGREIQLSRLREWRQSSRITDGATDTATLMALWL